MKASWGSFTRYGLPAVWFRWQDYNLVWRTWRPEERSGRYTKGILDSRFRGDDSFVGEKSTLFALVWGKPCLWAKRPKARLAIDLIFTSGLYRPGRFRG